MNNILIRIRKECSALRFAGILMMMVLGFYSCNFLNIDDYIDEEMKYDSIFATKRYIEAYMWDAANKFPDEGNLFQGNGDPKIYLNSPGIMASDEGFTLFGTGEYQGMAYVQGEINADNLKELNCWHRYYQIIRQCNTIVTRIDEASDWETSSERTLVLAYTRFIRAYAYYNLLVNWGPVVILYDEMPNNNEEIEYYDRPRDLYDDCVEYVCTEFEAAAKDLPERARSILEYGRPTRGAAYALVARLRLLHASPLFNGGQVAKAYYGGWTRKDGKHYIAQTPDPRRWAVAAAAAKRVMELKIAGLQAYKLHTVERDEFTPELPKNVDDLDYYEKNFPEGAKNIDPLRSYSEMFNGESVAYSNQEIIWARNSSSLRSYTQRSFPFNRGGQNGICVTQKIVDAYEMVDGRVRTNSSPDYPYSESGFTELQTSFSGYRLNAGVSNMYVNREMRFYASIGFSECFWPLISTSESSYKNYTATYYSDSDNGRMSAPNNYPVTGYVIKKYINPMDAWRGTSAMVTTKAFPIIRYAEILLSYAEALNALDGSYDIEMEGLEGGRQTFSRDVIEIKKAINQVRYRSGLPGLTDAEAADPAFVLAKIKKERMVEFLFENRRYYDVRRWGDYEESESQPIMGMNTLATKDSYYQRTIPNSTRISNRVVNRKMIFLPIPRTELKRIPLFDQNPGW